MSFELNQNEFLSPVLAKGRAVDGNCSFGDDGFDLLSEVVCVAIVSDRKFSTPTFDPLGDIDGERMNAARSPIPDWRCSLDFPFLELANITIKVYGGCEKSYCYNPNPNAFHKFIHRNVVKRFGYTWIALYLHTLIISIFQHKDVKT